jgi:hypothetical protein
VSAVGTNGSNIDIHLKKFEVVAAMQARGPNAWQLVGALIDQKKWNIEVFMERSRLDGNSFYKAQRGDPAPPTLATLMAICIAMSLDMSAAEMLLGAAGIKLSTSIPLHRAYLYIINHLAGEPIAVCNEFLRRLHFKELGSANYYAQAAS